AAAGPAEAPKTPPNMANKLPRGQLTDFSEGGFANGSGNGLSLLEKSGEFVNTKCNRRSAPADAILTASAVPCGAYAAFGSAFANPLNDEDPGAAQSAGASAVCHHRQRPSIPTCDPMPNGSAVSANAAEPSTYMRRPSARRARRSEESWRNDPLNA